MVKVQQRGLGRGLSALISETVPVTENAGQGVSAPASMVSGMQELLVGGIVPGKFQPRMRFSEESLRELAASIEKNGIMQPIVVRAVGGGKHEIVAGERRWRAAQLAGLTRVPVVIRELSDQQALELALIENIQRADLSPLEEALGYQRLLEEFGYTQDELASVVGKSRSHVANLLRLMTLPQEIKLMLDEGKLSMGHARALLGLPLNQALPIAEAVAQRGLSVRQVEALARNANGAPRIHRPRQSSPRVNMPHLPMQPKDADVIALEETLSASFGVQVSINDRGQGGEIVLAYESLAQLDEILRRLSSATSAASQERDIFEETLDEEEVAALIG